MPLQMLQKAPTAQTWQWRWGPADCDQIQVPWERLSLKATTIFTLASRCINLFTKRKKEKKI